MAGCTLTAEESNHLRAVYLSYRVAPKAVRTYFDNIHPPVDLVTHLKADKPNLQKIKGNIIRPFQWSQLYPSTGTPQPVSTDLDVTLLTSLLRNMTPEEPAPPFGFDTLPDKAHTTNGAHMARIKFYRNSLAHSTDGKLSNTDFATLWFDLEIAIIGIGGSSYRTEINVAKTIPLDNTLIDLLRNMNILAKQYSNLSSLVDNNTDCIEKHTKELNELKKGIKNLDDNQRILEVKQKIEQIEADIIEKSEISSKQEQHMAKLYEKLANEWKVHVGFVQQLDKRVDAMEKKPHNVCDSHRLKIEEWEKDDKLFVTTIIIEDILEFLKRNHCLTVTGSPGIGKSASIHHVALVLRDTHGYHVFPCNNPSQIGRFYQKEKRQLFIFDDVCGKYSVAQSYIDKWKKHTEDLNHMISLGNVKILCSCRIQVFVESQFQSLKMLTGVSCNLNSKKYLLQNEVKLQIAKQYLSEENVDSIKDNLNRYEFLPLIFSLFRLLHQTNKAIEVKNFFQNPFEIYTKELDKLQEENDKSKFCALFMLVVHNGSLCRNLLTDDESKDDRKRRKDIFEECGVPRDTLRQHILEQLESLTDFLVKINFEGFPQKQSFSTCHDKLFDFLCSYFGQRLQRGVIKFANSNVIRDRTQFESLGQGTKEFTIIIKKGCEQAYFQRITSDWVNGHINDMFYNNQMKTKEYRDKLLAYIAGLDDETVHGLVKAAVGCTSIAWKRGYVEIYKYLITKQAEHKMGITYDDLNCVNCHHRTPLTYACESTDIPFIGTLISNGASVNYDDWGVDFPPGLSSLYGYTDFYPDRGLNCPLGAACSNGNLEIITLLLHNGADVNLRYFDESSAICNMSLNHEFEIKGKYPVARAVQAGNTSVVRTIIAAGADLNTWTNGKTPLEIACFENNLEMVEFLLDEGVDVNKFHWDWGRPIFTACANNSTEIVRRLVDAGANIHVSNSYGRTPLFVAIDNNKYDTVEYLINKGADVNHRDIYYFTPIAFACWKEPEFKMYHIVELLLQKGADLNMGNKYGNISLIIARMYPETKCEQLLKEKHQDAASNLNYINITDDSLVGTSEISGKGINVNIEHDELNNTISETEEKTPDGTVGGNIEGEIKNGSPQKKIKTNEIT